MFKLNLIKRNDKKADKKNTKILKVINFITNYRVLSFIFSVLSLYLISFTLPLAKVNIVEYMENARTLLLALGAGFFGLLGFIVAGFSLSSGKMPDTFKKQLNMYSLDMFRTKKHKDNLLNNYLIINKTYSDILNAFKNTIAIIIFNIISTFVSFIITLIPNEFNEVLFWLCISVIVTSFYLAIFNTMKLFKLGMTPLSIDLIFFEFEIRELIEHHYREFGEISLLLRERIKNNIKNGEEYLKRFDK
ncbi:hypothetical protein CIB95_11700 [Lottiidibacillus patelloidae]|uniref:Uncharacterized protein n=1 Tax=Lottiidibacillus patelloidae TaxID=2670334 RepID=A0A263BS77_9BACI|nr:hypothetical protein [Lottiidibacillus patelloidae]OZM56432.1 hypothetical protein CIB95_11700 [Lottiidibacillus patelloidae]